MDSRTTNGDRDSLLALARESSSGSGAAGAEEDDSVPSKFLGRKVGYSWLWGFVVWGEPRVFVGDFTELGGVGRTLLNLFVMHMVYSLYP